MFVIGAEITFGTLIVVLLAIGVAIRIDVGVGVDSGAPGSVCGTVMNGTGVIESRSCVENILSL